MPAPSPTARQTPSGIKLDDGFRCLVTFANAPAISLWEKEVTPPPLEGGEPVNTTTMHNVTWRTRNPRKLIEMGDATFMCAYDPNVYNLLLAQINRKTTVTVTFPDGSTLAFFGYLRSFKTNRLVEGTQPDAECTFIATNQDPQSGAEEAPVLTSVSGT